MFLLIVHAFSHNHFVYKKSICTHTGSPSYNYIHKINVLVDWLLTSTFMEYWGRAWADFCAAQYTLTALHVHSTKAVYNSGA